MSIRRKLSLLILAIGLVPTLAVSLVAYVIIGNELTERMTDQLSSTAIKQEQKISGLLQVRQEETIKLSNRFDLQSALGGYVSSRAETDRRMVETILVNRKVQTPDIQAIYLAIQDGSIVAATNTTHQKLPADSYAFQPGKETSMLVKEDERDGIVKMYVTTRISVNKQPEGYLSMVFRIDDIVATVQDYTGLGATGETVVGARQADGEVLSLFPLRFDSDGALKVRLTTMRLFDHVGMSHDHDNAVDYRGKPVIVAPRTVSFADWVISTKIDQEEALAPIMQLRDALVVIGVILSLLTVGIALYLTRLFTGPIMQIAKTAQLIGQGAFDSRVLVQRRDEIGTLSRSINMMGHNLGVMVTNIKSQRNQLEVILNSTAESILAIDAIGTILIANESAAVLAQSKLHEIIGRNINDVFPWTHEMQPFVVNYDTPGTKTYFDLQYKNQIGVERYVKLIVSRASGGSLDDRVQTIVTIHDETKSRELENMKLDFVSMAAHELRTPLAAIRGYLELIMYKSRNVTQETSQFLKQALRSTAELGGLINNLLNVTRIERGTLTFHLEKIDLAVELKRVLQDVGFGAEDKSISLEYTGPDDGALVVGDQLALREVMGNLLSNAIKYTDRGGEVRVLLRSVGGGYRVDVRDTGIGIPEQALPNLFSKFFRAHSGLNSGNPGTGLGLFIAKSIVERHRGTITVQSKEGVGSVFSFTLPRWSDELFRDLQNDEHVVESNIRRHRGWITKDSAR